MNEAGRYRVLPPQRLGLFIRGGKFNPPAGVSDEEFGKEIVSLGDMLWRPDGTRRTLQEVTKHVGWRAAWVAELRHNLQVRLCAPPPFSEPPAVFLSYRWGTDEQNRWVANLADTLRERGYRVLLDRLVPPDEIDVPAFVSGIVDARYFLAIIDPGYVERLGAEAEASIKDGWVFDEVQTAFRAENDGLIRIVGLLREGEVLPSGFTFPAYGQLGKVIDVREPGRLDRLFDDIFPRHRPLPKLDLAEAAYGRSLAAFAEGDLAAAFDHAREVVACAPQIIDGYLQQARVCLAASTPVPGLAAANAALDRFPDYYELHLAAAIFAYDAGDSALATRHAARALAFEGLPPEERARAHCVLGNSLDDFGEAEAALAHVALAIRTFGRIPLMLQSLGYLRRRLGEPEAAALLFAEALGDDPGSAALYENLVSALIEAGKPAEARAFLSEFEQAHPDHAKSALLAAKIAQAEQGAPVLLVVPAPRRAADLRVTCSDCEAGLRLAEKESLCAGCGRPRKIPPMRCDLCDADGLVPIIPGLPMAVRCPFCGTGLLAIESMHGGACPDPANPLVME